MSLGSDLLGLSSKAQQLDGRHGNSSSPMAAMSHAATWLAHGLARVGPAPNSQGRGFQDPKKLMARLQDCCPPWAAALARSLPLDRLVGVPGGAHRYPSRLAALPGAAWLSRAGWVPQYDQPWTASCPVCVGRQTARVGIQGPFAPSCGTGRVLVEAGAPKQPGVGTQAPQEA